MKVNIKLLHADAIIPKYQTSGSAGFDIHAVEHTEVYPGETKVLKTGLSFEIPEGYELQIVPRSGISAKTKLRISNSPGTIDSDFRGEVGIIVDNIAPVIQATFIEVDNLEKTERGKEGFGSTGTGALNTINSSYDTKTTYVKPTYTTLTNDKKD